MASEVVRYRINGSRNDEIPSDRAIYDLRGDNQAIDVDRWLGSAEPTDYKTLAIFAAIAIAVLYFLKYKKR